MKKIAIIAAVVACLVAAPAAATEAFTVTISKVGANTYKLDGKNIVVKTVNCAESAASSAAILIVNNGTGKGGKLSFVKTRKSCEIAELTPMKYVGPSRITVNTPNAFTQTSIAAQKAANDVIAALRD